MHRPTYTVFSERSREPPAASLPHNAVQTIYSVVGRYTPSSGLLHSPTSSHPVSHPYPKPYNGGRALLSKSKAVTAAAQCQRSVGAR